MPKYSGFDPIQSHQVVTTSSSTGSVNHANTSAVTALYLPFDTSVTADAGPENVTVTAGGQASLNTTTKKVGAASLNLSESSGADYLTFPTPALNGDFTIEGFFRTTMVQSGSSPSTRQSLFTYSIYNDATDSYAGMAFWLNGNGTLTFYTSTGGNSWDISAQAWGNITVNTWHHFAVTRSGTTINGYFDGTRTFSLTGTNAFHTSATTTALGSRNSGGAYGFNGQIDDFRILNGVALYTDTSLTVPTSPVGVYPGLDPVSLYLPFDSDINDDSAHGHTVTAAGSATISSTQAKFGGNSLSLNGTSQYLTVSNDTAFQFGSEDFTVEAWVYQTAAAGSDASDRHAIVSRMDSSSNRSWNIGTKLVSGEQRLQFGFTADGSSSSEYTFECDVTINTWHHIAIVRSGSGLYGFLNGKLLSSSVAGVGALGTQTIYAGTSDLAIGYRGLSTQYFEGYIDDLRISKGVSRYTKSFVPPSQAVGATLTGTNETNTTTGFTSLYLPFDSDVNDDSPQSHTVTAYGNAAISSTQAKFGSYSLSLDGTGDYLQIADDDSLEFDDGDLTIEAWLYQNDDTGHVLVCKRDASGGWSSGAWIFGVNTNIAGSNDDAGKVQFWAHDYNTGASLLEFDNGSAFSSGWHHFAITRASDVWMLFVDGTQVDTQEWTGSIGDASHPVIIGRDTYSSGRYETNGYIDDFRILKGHAKYTGDFIPPSSAVGTSVSETVNDLNVLYMPFDSAEQTSSVAASQTSLYLPFDSDTNDDSAQSHTVTNNGVTISSAQSKFGGYSALFDGTNDYLSIPSDSSLVFGSEDFTVEFFVYLNDDTFQTPFSHRAPSPPAGAGDWTLPLNRTVAGQIEWYNGDYSVSSAVVSTTISGGFSGGWHHIAVTRSGNVHRIFFDGELKASATNSTAYSSGPSQLHIGRDNYVGGRYYVDGYLEDIRIIKGTALYTESFTVPTSAVGATGTAISVVGGFEDQARNNSVTKFGDVTVNTSVKKFGTSSAYFDGTTDRLVVDHGGDLNLSSGDFTIEGWFYFTSNGTARIFHGEEGSGTYSPWLFYATSAGSLRFYASSNYSSWDVVSNALIGSVTLNTWTHLAVTREGNSFRCFQDGTLNSTTTSSSSLYYNTDRGISIGGRDGDQYMTGYIDDLRIVKGKAMYTESFTPPASAHGTELSDTSTSVTTDTKSLSSTWTMTNDGSSPRSFIDMRSDNTWANNEHLQTQPSHRWNPANAGGTPGTTATGGSIATPGNGYRYHVFTTPGTFQLSAIDGGSPSLAVEYLVVGGGGGGAANRAGGGGAGGLRTNEDGNPKAGSAMTIATGSFPVVVGTGGAGGDFVPGSITFGDNGTVSSFNSIESAGGGTSRSSGGSGGGGHSAPPYAAGSGNTPPVSPPQGNDGGAGHYPHGGGGGGGAGAAGSAGNPNAGDGGAGHAMPSFSGPILSPAIPGSMATAIGPTGLYAGGGGGGGSGAGPGVAGAGGPGGGGNGGNASVPPSSYNPNSGVYGPGGADAVDGTGGGGGGGGNAPGNNPWMQPAGDGGNGIVIIKYAY